MKPGPKQQQEYTELAAQLGINRSQAVRMGKDQCRKLLAMDEFARRIVLTKLPVRANSVTRKQPSTVDRMMELATRRKA